MPVSVAHAQSLSTSQEVKVRAVVAPAQYIILSPSNQILEIGSNSNQPSTPQVYRSKIRFGTQIPLSQAVFANYQALIQGNLHAGILYKASSAPSSPKRISIQKLDLLSI